MKPALKFSIDRGGTFTDIIASCQGRTWIKKILSVDPLHYDDAPREGIRLILEEVTGENISSREIPGEYIESIRMGTTVATNAMLEKKGAPTALVVTRGFKDILAIGHQDRSHLFNLEIIKPVPLYREVLELDERIVPSGDFFRSEIPLDRNAVKKELQLLFDAGIESLAVVLMHAWGDGSHEDMVGALAEEIGFSNISLSSRTSPSIKIVDRAFTTLVDAYVTPIIKEYVEGFRAGFDDDLGDDRLFFMHSGGGLIPASRFRGVNALLSGPAGGVVGYGESFYRNKPVIGFDMGGTSTDVSRYDGRLSIHYESRLMGQTVRAPHVDILTVAAGGGSRLFFRNGMLEAGPESAGSEPGPLCYRKGGCLTITDANLFLGRIIPGHFPEIFGPEENQPLDTGETRKAFEKITDEINRDYGSRGLKGLSPEEVASGFLAVANEIMIKPVKEVSIERGFDVRDHVLACFGGAGPQHACAIARHLGINEIYIHRHAGILSAIGIAMASEGESARQSINRPLEGLAPGFIEETAGRLWESLSVAAGSGDQEQRRSETLLALRYEGTDSQISIDAREADPVKCFETEHRRLYGFLYHHRGLILDEIRVTVVSQPVDSAVSFEGLPVNSSKPLEWREVFFDDSWSKTPVYDLESLGRGQKIEGPAVLVHNTETIVIEPRCMGEVTAEGHIRIIVEEEVKRKITPERDPVSLGVFNNIFMSVAEQMGSMLRKTAVSTNIKERMDFSCAVFDARGRLVANAPHIPVHLGAMGHTVQHINRSFKNNINEGDMFLSNHPAEGGSHLPDITVVAPRIIPGSPRFPEPEYFVACRGHHGDIGGTVPGSMPALSSHIDEEGAVFRAMKVLEGGRFKSDKLKDILVKAGARRVADNISDITAQISACVKGLALLDEVCERYSLMVVKAYMGHIQDVSKEAVRDFIGTMTGPEVRHARDFLDDGTVLDLVMKIDHQRGTILFDFTGSGDQVPGNQNCPAAVTTSSIIYCLRALVARELPLNAGFLLPVSVKLRRGSLLDPAPDAAVAGGNVTTSQRVVDLILKAFDCCAASCGCMNNVSFGNDHFGYYETIGGGSGAGRGYHGADGIHTHMTNTRITDPEILELRYPVILREFSLRSGSGGKGRYNGGCGIIREIEFNEQVEVSLLTERRVSAPWGSHGGGEGTKGKNFLIREGKSILLDGKSLFTVNKGDRLRIETPGGGGYGKIS